MDAVETGNPTMSPMGIKEKLAARLGDANVELLEGPGDPAIRVAPERIRDAVACLRDDADLRFDCLLLVSGVDYEDHIDVVYHLRSYPNAADLAVKVSVPRENPSLPSLCDLHAAANWHERETFDLLGVRFEGHPNLRRILLPEDWEGHPLRKDYEPPEEYHGVSNL